MQKIIIDGVLRKVVYDTEAKTYTKTIKLKWKKKIKCILGLRKYPGENIKYIAEIFQKNGIKTFNVLEYSKHSVVTSEIEGRSLMDEILETKSKEEAQVLIDKFVSIVTKIINLNVYYGDFNFNNFIVSNGEVYAIDLEDYRKDFLTKFRKKSTMKRLKRQLLEKEEVLIKMHEYFNGEKIYQQIEKELEKNK
ncbi:RIO1 family regulatory kinase/ATPase [Fusobacterium ulcerans]|uniref:RIO1 family regulatory kinase/ATPase n=1 Tax=Fusobacterium ulcerans TaxID=861 RepID=UPI00241C473E|nr:RIO1 family regulatory kinase/ATPase [Fusobacterium ulcerans]